jgi:hypothetical protein
MHEIKDVPREVGIRIRFPHDLYVDLKRLAERDTRSFNGEVVHLLREAVDDEAEQ